MKKLPLLTKPTVSIRDPPQQPAQPNFKIRVPCQLPLPAKPAEPIIQIRVPPQLPVIQRMQMDVPNEATTKTTLQFLPHLLYFSSHSRLSTLGSFPLGL